ncbi:MAG: class I SAM-dependent methyltransferase [Actinomycetota bacterium]|nr:class I SAM-dependent methyltransferase [Actinomycetota bacterium]
MPIPFSWQAEQFHELLPSAARDDVAPYILRHLDPRGPTLEAGCGLGRFVAFMEHRGFQDVRGLDVSPEAVAIVNRLAPHLEVTCGDVSSLPFEDDSVRGIVSLGVVEHFREGPGPALREMARVMMPGGVAVVTVPYLNLVRRLKRWLRLDALGERLRGGRPAGAGEVVARSVAELGRREEEPAGPLRFVAWPATGPFFEYRFAAAQMRAELEAVGLSIVEVARLDTVSGMFYELGRLLVRSSAQGRTATLAGRAFGSLFSRAPWVHAHMLLFVARKPDGAG